MCGPVDFPPVVGGEMCGPVDFPPVVRCVGLLTSHRWWGVRCVGLLTSHRW